MNKLLISLFLLASMIACNMVSQGRRPAQTYKYTDESVVKLKVPLSLMKREIQAIADSSSMIKKVNYLSMDPLTRVLTVDLTVKYPLETLLTGWGVEPPKYYTDEQNVVLAVSFPKAKMMANTRYLNLKFHRFDINGTDYLSFFPTVANVVNTFIVNSDLLNYVYDMTDSSLPKGDDGEYYRNLMREVLENNGIRVNATMKSMAFKLNLKYIENLANFTRYKEYKDLRIWQFSPFLLQGTSDVFFHFEAGLGKPSKVWLNQYDARVAQDKSTILEVRNAQYKEFSNVHQVNSSLKQYLAKLLEQEKIKKVKLTRLYQNDVKKFEDSFLPRAKDNLTLSNENFEADPENEYMHFIGNQKERIKNYVTDLDRRLTIDQHIQMGGVAGNKKPLITKRLGSDVVNASMNFLRDYEYEKQFFIKEAYVGIAPQVPGLIMKGKVNIDLNYVLGYMDKGLIDAKIDSQILETKEGIPFEMVLEVKTGDDSWLGLDAKSISIMEGSQKVTFTRNEKTQKFFLDFIKLYLVQTMASIEYDLGGESSESEEVKEKRKLKELLSYLNSLKSLYNSSNSSGIFNNIVKMMATDIKENPFASAGADFIKNKKKILFGDIFFFDEKDQLFKIKMDPKIAIDNIMGVKNDLQIWSVSPLYSKEFNNTFLEITVGNGRRTKNYVEQLNKRANNLDNANFVGIYQDNQRSTADMLVSVHFDYLETYINKLFQDVIKLNNGKYAKALEEDEKQSHYILENLKIEILDKSRINIDLKASEVVKKQHWLSRKWKVDKKSYGITAQITLASKDLKDVKHLLRDHKVPIYFTDQLIALTINKAKIKFGKPTLVNKALSKLTNFNLDSTIGSKFRGLILMIVNKYFQGQWKEKDDKKLFGHSIEEMARVFTTKKEIMLMINPRVSGAAFEVKLTGRDDFVKNAIVVDKKEQELHMALTAAIGIVKIDKREMMNYIKQTNDLINPYLKIKSKSKFIKKMADMQLVSKAVLNTDSSKISLYNRLIRLMRNYDPVMQSVNIPHKAKNADRRITTCATELMYFSAASYLLYNRLYKLTKKIKDWKLTGKIAHYKTLVEAKNKLFNNIFKPLMYKYRDDYHKRNKAVTVAPYSYWTQSFYADAYFSETIYKELQKEGI